MSFLFRNYKELTVPNVQVRFKRQYVADDSYKYKIGEEVEVLSLNNKDEKAMTDLYGWRRGHITNIRGRLQF